MGVADYGVRRALCLTIVLAAVGAENFSLRSYWNSAYAGARSGGTAPPAEWLVEVDVALPAVQARIEQPPRSGGCILVAGCGTSRLGEALCDEGWRVINADFSEACITHGRERTGPQERLSWEVMDVRALPLEDTSVDAVVDKGTLDALMCGDAFDSDVSRYMAEVQRVLKPGGHFVAISLSQPSVVLPLLDQHCSSEGGQAASVAAESLAALDAGDGMALTAQPAGSAASAHWAAPVEVSPLGKYRVFHAMRDRQSSDRLASRVEPAGRSSQACQSG